MSLQKVINKTMDGITSSIKASTQKQDQNLDRLNKLKSCVDKVVNLSISDIAMKENIRSRVDVETAGFKQLCESIKIFGLMKNIVAELRISADDSYELICVAGHRRLIALQQLNYQEKIPCLIKIYSKGQRVGAALSENINRENLNCVDIANGYQSLIKHGWSNDDLVKHFEKDKKTIARYLRLAEAPSDVKKLIQDNPTVLSNRIVFNDILAKSKTHGEIRKAIKRKVAKTPNIKSAKESKKYKIQNKLNQFFKKKNLLSKDKKLVLEAFQFAGLLD